MTKTMSEVWATVHPDLTVFQRFTKIQKTIISRVEIVPKRAFASGEFWDQDVSQAVILPHNHLKRAWPRTIRRRSSDRETAAAQPRKSSSQLRRRRQLRKRRRNEETMPGFRPVLICCFRVFSYRSLVVDNYRCKRQQQQQQTFPTCGSKASESIDWSHC